MIYHKPHDWLLYPAGREGRETPGVCSSCWGRSLRVLLEGAHTPKYLSYQTTTSKFYPLLDMGAFMEKHGSKHKYQLHILQLPDVSFSYTSAFYLGFQGTFVYQSPVG